MHVELTYEQIAALASGAPSEALASAKSALYAALDVDGGWLANSRIDSITLRVTFDIPLSDPQRTAEALAQAVADKLTAGDPRKRFNVKTYGSEHAYAELVQAWPTAEHLR